MATPRSCANVAEQFLATDWNALISVEQNGSANHSSYNVSLPPSNEGIVEQMMTPSLLNSSFPDIECSFDLSAGGQINSTLCSPDFLLSNKHCIERNIKGRKRKTISETAGLQLGASLIKSSEAKEQKDVTPESVKSSRERDEKKEKGESNHGLSAHKSASNQAKEFSQDYDPPKEEYIHVRAKRGQATNSHSLAERVRREKISERMRVLQDLVPGCNKITGKAVMLDEIINYVQSLQRQVEFLSMKLAAVHPELKFDIEQIFSKDVHQLDGNPTVLDLGPGLSTQYTHFHGAGQVHSETLITSTMHQLSSMSQMPNVWDDELQNATEMVFIPQHPVYNSGLNNKDQRIS